MLETNAAVSVIGMSSFLDGKYLTSHLINRTDASGRVTGVKGNRHKSYSTWEEALDGWRQNCRSYHRHGPDFVDGTLFRPQVQGNIPPPVNPLPSQHNVVFLPSSPLGSSSGHSLRSSPSRNLPRPRSVGSGSYSSEPTHRHWALRSAGFIGVVSRYANLTIALRT